MANTLRFTELVTFNTEIQPVHSEGDQPWDLFGRTDEEAAAVESGLALDLGKIGREKNSSQTLSANSSQGGTWQKP